MAYLVSKAIGINDVSLVLLGCLLPDLTFVSLFAISKVFRINKHDVYVHTAPFHTPFIVLLLSTAIATATTDPVATIVYLLFGAASHFVLDLLSKGSSVELLYPFCMIPISFKLFWTESISGYTLLVVSSISLAFALLADPTHLTVGFHFSVESILILGVILIFVRCTRNLIREKYFYFKFSKNPELWGGKRLFFATRYVKSVDPLRIEIANGSFEAVTEEALKIGDQISFSASYHEGRLCIESLHRHNAFLKMSASLLGFILFMLIIAF